MTSVWLASSDPWSEIRSIVVLPFENLPRFDVADERRERVFAEARPRLGDQAVALRLLLADREDAHARLLRAERFHRL